MPGVLKRVSSAFILSYVKNETYVPLPDRDLCSDYVTETNLFYGRMVDVLLQNIPDLL